MNRQTIVMILLFALALIACKPIDIARVTESSTQQEAATIEPLTAAPLPEAETATTEESTAAAQESEHPAAQLITAFTEPAATNGELLILYGQVLDVNGNPVPDATVEIWQTDATGVYDHPGDAGTGNRDLSFQFYGTATVDVGGWYAFRTIVPGRYEPRPRHIHFKVKQRGNTLLTSQFYFSDDIAEVQGEGMFQAVGEGGDRLLLQLVQGEGQLLAHGRIVVDTGIGAGSLPLTPGQGEGPYYPVVDLAAYDNDLVQLP
ncbi:MAG: hypothetical protein R3C14_35005 [Caldilineaceae bacterium]